MTKPWRIGETRAFRHVHHHEPLPDGAEIAPQRSSRHARYALLARLAAVGLDWEDARKPMVLTVHGAAQALTASEARRLACQIIAGLRIRGQSIMCNRALCEPRKGRRRHAGGHRGQQSRPFGEPAL